MIDRDDPGFEAEKRKRLKLKNDYEHYSSNCLMIRPKAGNLVHFSMNKAQKELHRIVEEQRKKIGFVRVIVLKGRQQGISTYVEGRFYWRVTHRKGVRAFILTHEEAATNNLFEMVERYHDNCPKQVKPRTGSSSSKELSFFKLDSGYRVGTAGAKGTGRSSTIQYFHGSEVAFWPHADTHATGVMQGIPREPDTEVFLESTANGIGNYFHAQWVAAEAGETDYIAVFLPWYWQDEYKIPVPDGFTLMASEVALLDQFKADGLTVEHLAWRRLKTAEFTSSAGGGNGEWKFRQEYPFTAAEAFQTSGEDGLISPEAVMQARKTNDIKAIGAKIVGVDPARFGDDKTGIAFRQGRVISEVITYSKKNTMEIAGICANILQDPVTELATDIDMMFIDEGGLGAGVLDRLNELGFEDRVTGVNGGQRARDKDRFVNKRAECWVSIRDWLTTKVSLPDDDSIQADLCSPMYTYDSSSRILIEKKEKMKARGIPSTDKGDSISLTFAEPVAPAGLARKYRQVSQIVADDAVGY